MHATKDIRDFHEQMAPLGKEQRRAEASKLASAMTQRNPLGTYDLSEQLLMRHYFVYLPTEDISKYISNFMLGVGNTPQDAKSLWIGEPPMWASVCRMMHACYNKTMWEAVWQTSVKNLGKANAQVLAGMYSVAYDKQYYDTWNRSTENVDSAWLNPHIFSDWDRVHNDTKLKIWMIVSTKKDADLLRQFSYAMNWSQQWAIAENLLGDNMFEHDHGLREISLKQILFNKHKVDVYPLPDLAMT